MALNPAVYVESPTEDFYTIIHQGINEYAVKRGLAGTGGYFYVVYDEGKVIAAISGFDNFGPAEIGGLWVDEKYRSQGYGKLLVEKAQEWAKQKGCKAMTVFTLKDWPAYAWYQRLGFEVEFERHDHRNSAVGCYLIKRLSDVFK